MKKLLLFLVICLIAIPFVSGFFTNVVNDAPFLINSADSNDAALTVSTTNWDDLSSWANISQRGGNLKVMFYVTDETSSPDNSTFKYIFYVADSLCNAQVVASGAATCGAAQLSRNPINNAALDTTAGDPNEQNRWVDTLGTITTDWKDSDIDAQNDDGADSVAAFIFDRQSGKKAWCRIYERSSSTMTVNCIATYYE